MIYGNKAVSTACVTTKMQLPFTDHSVSVSDPPCCVTPLSGGATSPYICDEWRE